MSERILLDTDVLIDYLRGVPQAVEFVDGAGHHLHLSVVSITELYAGAREPEMERIRTVLATISTVTVSVQIARTGGMFRRQYMRSHGLGIADALIAATAREVAMPLVTLNRKHFPMLPVVTPYTKP
ncbi:MAG TPA: type II toxin-antitoxin system VapC family toxin [Longimicrobium sp.]|nr:type II toxin-antitoxin system VapC family toxin [Longimicrobium sp.]